MPTLEAEREYRQAAKQCLSSRPRVGLTSLGLGILCLVVIWIGIASKHVENRLADIATAEKDLENFTLLFEENILRSIGEIDKTLRYLRKSIAVAGEKPDYGRLVRAADISSDLLVQVAIIDSSGRMVASSATHQVTTVIDLSDREHFRVHLENDTDTLFISKPVIGRASGKLSVQFTRRFLNADGSFGGVVVASLNPKHFDSVFNRVHLGDGASYALLGTTDGVVRASAEDFGKVTSRPQHVDWERLSGKLGGKAANSFWNDEPGERMLVNVRPVSGHPLAAVAWMPEGTVLAASRYSLRVMSILGHIGSCLVAILAWMRWKYEQREWQQTEKLRQSNEALQSMVAQLANTNLQLNRVELEGRRQKSILQSVFENSPDCLIQIDTEFKILITNSTFETTFGGRGEEYCGSSLAALFRCKKVYDELIAELMREQPSHVSTQAKCVRKNQSEFPVEISVAHLANSADPELGMLVVIRDVTKQQERDAAQREKQRLAALGRLAGGIAHDFNNLLTVISGNLQLLQLDADPERRKRYISDAETASEIGARLNQRLIMFARHRRLDPKPTNLDALVRGLLYLIESSLGERITLEVELDGGASSVWVDPSEMENAILNLVFNARDAMEEGGRLRIETKSMQVLPGIEQPFGEVAPDHYVKLLVLDTGVGMPPEVLSRACEPFFTTKPDGKGSGLGLTTLHGFIEQSNGILRIESHVGQGTRVSIYLPISEVAASDPREPTMDALQLGSGEIVLLVEDNERVRAVTKNRLKLLGYRVMDVSNGQEALDVVTQGGELDLVLTDVVMPGHISGFELGKRLKLVRPTLPVLFVSGFPDELAKLEVGFEQISVLRKPYTQEALAGRIAQALGRSRVADA